MAPEPKLSNTDVKTNRARRHAREALWRLSVWGTAAAIALTAAVFSAQTETGARRLQMAFANSSAPDSTAKLATAQQSADEAEAQVRQLTTLVQKLAADGEHLDKRLAGIERDFEDLTGTITRRDWQNGAASLAPPIPLSLPGELATLAPWPEPELQPKEHSITESPAAVAAADMSAQHPVAAIALKRLPKAEAPASAAPKTASLRKTMATATTATATTVAPAIGEQRKFGTPPKTITVALLPTAAVGTSQRESHNTVEAPLPPERMAALPPTPAPTKPAFGIDIGGASSKTVLRARWLAVEANFGSQVAQLHPIVAHDRHAGHLPYRLVIGPLSSQALAASLCARFGLTRSLCYPARFIGEPLAQR